MTTAPPRDLVAPVRLAYEGTLLKSRMKIHRKERTIVLSQKTRLWFRAAVCLWATIVVMTPFMIYSEWFLSTTTRFTCDRGTGICSVDGRSGNVPRLADIGRAEMDRDFNRRDGVNWGVNLVTRDGKKYALDEQRAIDDRVVADYRTSVKAINAYLANPAQSSLDTSFTYRASLGEKIQSLVYFVFGVFSLLIACALWTSAAYIVDGERVTVVTRWMFQRTTQEIAVSRIRRVVDRQESDGRSLQLQVDDAERITIATAGRARMLELGALAAELAMFLGKPLQSAAS
jgi:hypothetical protein